MKTINFLKTKNIIKLPSDETLSYGLSHLSSSHDAGFVFSDKGDLLGLINPYYSAIKSSNPGNAKIEHCLFHPPKLKTNYSLVRAVKLMIDSKIHYLPVFDDKEKFTGIVSARNLLGHLKESKLFDLNIGEYLKSKNKPMITVLETDLVSQAIHLMKTRKISKLVVIGRDMKLKGILTHYDLISYLITPRKKEHRGDRIGQRTSFGFQQVRNFAKSYVLTLTPEDQMKDALRLILEKQIGSVVIVDKSKHPIGIITTRDLLQLIAGGKEERQIEIAARNLSPESRQIVSGFFEQFANKVKKIPDIARARLMVKEDKGGGVFEAVLSLFPRRGKPKIIRTEGKNLVKVLKKIKKD